MSYAAIDPVISTWASRHSLTVYTQYKGGEVRSVDVVSSKGRKYQIWIDLPKQKGRGVSRLLMTEVDLWEGQSPGIFGLGSTIRLGSRIAGESFPF
jgi:hypothetical protein